MHKQNNNIQRTLNTQNPTLGTVRSINRVAGLALVGCALFTTVASANTQVRLQSASEAANFSEGYALSVEEWNASRQAYRNNAHYGEFHHESRDRPQVWIADIGTLLFNDDDGDGYHSGFSISIDVDSEYGDTEVYAKIYLRSEGEQESLLHKTERFAVYGTNLGDEYRIDTELRNNYPTSEYDVTIDIHDAWSHDLIDSASPRGFENLSQLPLESEDYNYSGDHSGEDQNQNGADVVVTEYAAFTHPGLLALMGGLVLMRVRRSKRG